MRILASLQFRVLVSTGLDFKKAETCTEEVLVVFVFWIKVIGFELGLMDSLRSKKALRSNQSNSASFESQNDSGGMSKSRESQVMIGAATAAIVTAFCQANDHGFGGLGGFSALGPYSTNKAIDTSECHKPLNTAVVGEIGGGGGGSDGGGEVIKDFYGDDGGFNSHPIFKGYHGAWSDILKAVSHIDEVDPSFGSSFKLKVSMGSNTFFWKDIGTLDGKPLKDSYPILFALENDSDCVISDR
ncbi:hypothetical protein Tco_0745952 [Tanacetum coccineum]